MSEDTIVYTNRPLKKGERYAIMVEFVLHTKSIPLYGKYKVDPRLISSKTQRKEKKMSRDKAAVQMIGLRGKLTKLNKELEDKKLSVIDCKVKLAERDKAQKEYDEVTKLFNSYEKQKTVAPPYVPTMQQLQQEFKNPTMKMKLAELLQNTEIQKKIQNREFNMTNQNYMELQKFIDVMKMAPKPTK